MSEPAFTHDVFLSHSAKDKAVVRRWRSGCGRTGGGGALNTQRSTTNQPTGYTTPPIKGSLTESVCINRLPAVSAHRSTNSNSYE
jgi:hypothetical protein